MPFDSQTGQYYDDGRPVSPTSPVQPRRKTPSLSPSRLRMTLLLIGINVVCFVVTSLLSRRAYANLAFSTRALERGALWTLITSMFMHSGFDHLFNNMVSLLFAGSRLEPRLGSAKFLATYLISGIAGGLGYYLVHKLAGDPALVVGASGAIFGLFGAYGYLIFQNHMLYGRGDGSPVTEAQIGIYAFFLIENIVYGLMSSGVANSAHMGGLIAGILLSKLLMGNIDPRTGLRLDRRS